MSRLVPAAIVLAVAACGSGDPPCDRCAGPDAATGPDAPPVVIAPTLLAAGRDGELAALALESPWAMRATARLATPVVAVRYHRGRFYVVHPTPADRISVLAADDLAGLPPIVLAAGADPRDIAFVDDDTAVISQHGLPSLATVALATGELGAIDLGPLADPGEGVAAGMLASCGPRVFVQLQRPTTPGLGVVDVDPGGGGSVVRTIATEYPPAFVMPIDCGSTLYVAEPIPLMLGGGGHQQIDLGSLTVSDLALADGLGEVGGFAMTGPGTGWFIMHTEFGPSPSSHLSLLPDRNGVWDTFADVHIDRLALDVPTSQLAFPDACTTSCLVGHATGVQVFDATTGAQLTTAAIDVGFPPVDVVVAR